MNIIQEKKSLETCRLDLDAAKAKLKKVKTLEMRDQIDSEVQAAQVRLQIWHRELLGFILEYWLKFYHSTSNIH